MAPDDFSLVIRAGIAGGSVPAGIAYLRCTADVRARLATYHRLVRAAIAAAVDVEHLQGSWRGLLWTNAMPADMAFTDTTLAVRLARWLTREEIARADSWTLCFQTITADREGFTFDVNDTGTQRYGTRRVPWDLIGLPPIAERGI
jgi:hypothetical protein